jgi:hypothetical protein
MTDDKPTDKSVSSEPASIVPTEVISLQPVLPAESGLAMQSLLMQGIQAKFKSGDLSAFDTIISIEADRIKFDQSIKQQELALRKQEQDRFDRKSERKHELDIKKLSQTDRSDQSMNSNLRLAIGAVCGVLLSTMVYSGITKDSAFSNQLITGVFGLLGGGGVTSALTKKDKPVDPKP